jgi:hypothetical protein
MEFALHGLHSGVDCGTLNVAAGIIGRGDCEATR